MARITGASNGTIDNCISYLKKIGVIERIGRKLQNSKCVKLYAGNTV